MKILKSILKYIIVLFIGLICYVGAMISVDNFTSKFFECTGIFIVLIYILLCQEMKN